MSKVRHILKKIHTPVTIMLIPHSRFNSFSLRVPTILLATVLCLACVGAVYTVSVSVQALEYYQVKKKFANMTRELREMESNLTSLKKEDSKLRTLSANDPARSSTNATVDEGSIDIEALKQQIKSSMNSVKEISAYLQQQQDEFKSTPRGWPAEGRISSGYGMRWHPAYGGNRFHSGIDIPLPRETPIHATADGVVSFSGVSNGSGNIVTIEHGHGFSTVYAHNTRNNVKVGQTVKRGAVIAYSGSTGVSTGPHLHYEVWRHDKSIDPEPFLSAKL